MTDSSNPRAPKSSRKKSAREPATIDLKATVVDDGARQENAGEDVKPEDRTAGETRIGGEEAVAAPEATLDSGMGVDSIGPQDPPQDTLAQDTLAQDTLAQDIPARETLPQEPVVHEQMAGEEPPRDVPPQDAPPEEARQEPPARRTSSAALIGTGLLGGLVGAGIVYGLQVWQTPTRQEDQRLAQLEQRVNALAQRPAPQAQGGAQPQADDGRVAALESATASLDQRVQAIQSAAEQAQAQAQEALNRPQPAAPQNDAALAEISSRLSGLEEQVRAGAQSASNAANAAQALEGRVAELDNRLAEQGSRLTQQEQRLAALSSQVTEANEGAEGAFQAGLRIVLAERLNEALRGGAPYADVLETLRRTGADAGRLAPLEPFAEQGAPTTAELAQRFEPLGAAILRESRGPAEGWSDRLMRMMDRVVTVRPVDEPGSTGAPSLVARIERALERGDVAEAAAAWEALPEPARRLSEEWGRQATAVAQAAQASQAVTANALAALNQTAQ